MTGVARLEARLDALRAAGRAAFIGYAVAGYPDLAGSRDGLRALAAAGADVLEVGPPYSDPLLDGPVIQRAASAALAGGTRLDDVLGLVAELAGEVGVPVVLLAYYNLVARRGPARFAADLAAAGGCGAVIPDLPPEEATEWLTGAVASGVAPVFLAAPTSTEARLTEIGRVSRGFVYVQASIGVTGPHPALDAGLGRLVARVRRHTRRAVCAGIGVSTAAQAAAVAGLADGVIVGSALVDRLAVGGVGALRELASDLATAVHNARPGGPGDA